MGFTMQIVRNNLFLFLIANYGGGVSSSAVPSSRDHECKQLSQKLHLEKTTVLATTYHPAGANLTIPVDDPSCSFYAMASDQVQAGFCRLQVRVETSNVSSLEMEAWLPDEWYGRFLGVGNSGLGGCLNYNDLEQGSYHHFATVGTNAGHNGDTVLSLLNNPESIKDFGHRAITTEVLIGKQIVSTYYNAPVLGKSYYTGCSTGGRQGFQVIQDYPDLFDGVIVGAPGFNFNRLIAALGRYGSILGLDPDSLFTSSDLSILNKDVLVQCDALDGLEDGIIDDPDLCDYHPEKLLCDPKSAGNSATCLSSEKVEAVRALFTPFYGEQGELICSRFDPGATGSPSQHIFGLGKHPYFLDWFRHVIYNDTSYTGNNFTYKDAYFAEKVNPGGTSAYKPDISTFRDRGGKVLTYHGTQDQSIPSGNSIRYFNSVSQTLSNPDLSSFYKHFQIPGMAHCHLGPGAWAFGQSGTTSQGLKNDSSSNLLLAMVEWVEGGKGPEMIVGTKFVDDIRTNEVESSRIHCPYPSRSKWNGNGDPKIAESWACV